MKHRDRWTLSVEQQQTIGFAAGLIILLYWAFAGFSPNQLLVGLVSMLLVGQRLITRKGDSDEGSRQTADKQSRLVEGTEQDEPGDDDRPLGRNRRDVFRRFLGGVPGARAGRERIRRPCSNPVRGPRPVAA